MDGWSTVAPISIPAPSLVHNPEENQRSSRHGGQFGARSAALPTRLAANDEAGTQRPTQRKSNPSTSRPGLSLLPAWTDRRHRPRSEIPASSGWASPRSNTRSHTSGTEGLEQIRCVSCERGGWLQPSAANACRPLTREHKSLTRQADGNTQGSRSMAAAVDEPAPPRHFTTGPGGSAPQDHPDSTRGDRSWSWPRPHDPGVPGPFGYRDRFEAGAWRTSAASRGAQRAS